MGGVGQEEGGGRGGLKTVGLEHRGEKPRTVLTRMRAWWQLQGRHVRSFLFPQAPQLLRRDGEAAPSRVGVEDRSWPGGTTAGVRVVTGRFGPGRR